MYVIDGCEGDWCGHGSGGITLGDRGSRFLRCSLSGVGKGI